MKKLSSRVVLALAMGSLQCFAGTESGTSPADVRVYQVREEGKPLFLVPVEDYRRLADPPPVPETGPAAPVQDRVLSCELEARIDGERADVTVRLELDLARTAPRVEGPRPGTETLVDPDGPTGPGAAIRAIRLVETPTVVLTGVEAPGTVAHRHGAYELLTSQAGPATVTMSFSLPVEESRGRRHLALPLAVAARQGLVLEIRQGAELHVELTGAIASRQEVVGEATRVMAAGQGLSAVGVSWESSVKVKEREDFDRARRDLAPELSSTVRTAVNVHGDHLRAQSRLDVQVRRNPISVLRLQAPAGVEILDVSGKTVKEWDIHRGPSALEVAIQLTSPVQDQLAVDLEYEQAAADAATFVPLGVAGAYHERHELGFRSPPSILLSVKDPGHSWKPMDAAGGSPDFQSLLGDALAQCFQSERFPTAGGRSALEGVKLGIQRLKKVALMQATIDLAECMTMITKEGHLLGRVTFQVKNNSQQFLKLRMPKDSRILTVFVGESAVNAARAGEDEVVIALAKSGRTSSGAAPFPVEVTYHQVVPSLESETEILLGLPKPDLGISTLRWTIGVPEGWALSPRGGNVHPDTTYRPVRFEGAEATQASGFASEAIFHEFTLPLRLDLPGGFEVVHFSRDLIEAEAREAPHVAFTVRRTTQGMVFRALAFLAGILLFYLILRHQEDARHRLAITGCGILGTATLLGIFPWAGSTIGIALHVALGVFVGIVAFGVSRLAILGGRVGDPAV